MSHSTELVVLAISVIITCVILVVSFSLAHSSRGIPNQMIQKFEQTSNDVDEYEIMKLAEGTVSGAEALAACRRLTEKGYTCGIVTKNGGDQKTNIHNATLWENNDGHTDGVQLCFVDFTNYVNSVNNKKNCPTTGHYTQYVNPVAEFELEVNRYENGKISYLKFEQTKITPLPEVSS